MITRKIWQTIIESPIITIFRHTKPDGDASGAQIGLKELIIANCLNKKVYCVGESNTYHGKLIGNVDENVSDDMIKNSLAIIVDTPNKDRIDNQKYSLAKQIIKIDHHIFVEDFGGIEWVDTKAIAACEMIVVLASENNLKISSSAADALYLGLITDSNRFVYNPTSRAYEMASLLLKANADYEKIYGFLYEGEEKMLRFKGYCQLNFKKTPNGVAYNKINEDILKQFDISGHDAAGTVNVLANIKDINMHVNFCQIENGLIRVEFRSKRIPVNEIANKYGGGGHKLASGTKVNSWQIVDAIIKDLDRLCEEEENNEL